LNPVESKGAYKGPSGAETGPVAQFLGLIAGVRRTNPLHRFERRPGLRAPPNSTLLGFRLRLAEDSTYFEVA